MLAESLSHGREGRGPRTSLDRLGDRQPDPGFAVLEDGRVLEDLPQRGGVVEAEQGHTALGVLGPLRRDVVDADDVLVQPSGHLSLGSAPRETTEQEGTTIIIRSSLRTISTGTGGVAVIGEVGAARARGVRKSGRRRPPLAVLASLVGLDAWAISCFKFSTSSRALVAAEVADSVLAVSSRSWVLVSVRCWSCSTSFAVIASKREKRSARKQSITSAVES